MPEYLSPGVYVEEFDIGPKPIEGVSTSTAGFLGETERGRTTPWLVTSWLDYQRNYGGYFGPDKYLPYAVKGFFDNGGQRCYIGRIVKFVDTPATNATLALGDLTATAIGEGAWGNRISIIVETGEANTAQNPLFKLRMYYWKTLPESLYDPEDEGNVKTLPRPTFSEIFDNLSVNEDSPNFYEKRVNDVSKMITLSSGDGDTVSTPNAPGQLTYMEGGEDGDGDLVLADFRRTDSDSPGNRRGLTAFKEVDDIQILYSPNSLAVNGLTDALITHCELLKDRFAVIDAEQGSADIGNLNPRNEFETKYAAFYYPWIKIVDAQSGNLRLVPPGGHVIGIYARSDNTVGVWKAPANEKVNGVKKLEFPITKGEQDVLNPRGVNAIRAFPGRGIRVWGARTLSIDTMWKYINVRRLFIFIEESIDEGTQWVVFEPNDQRLWARVRQTIAQFLTAQWRAGALMGTTPEEAFFVKCDRTTMTQDDIDNGRLICVIGIAPVKPAEFVIFRIAQFSGGTEIEEI
jgi:phage tail sheath protein FI